MKELMLALSYLRIAAKVLRAHKLRSLLTVVSITIGALSIVLMTSLADSGLQTIAKDIEDLGGARLLLLTPKQPERMKAKAAMAPGYLDKADQLALVDALPHVAEKTWYAGLEEKEVLAENGKSENADVVAGDTGFLPAFRFEVGKGRAFTDEENHSRANVCLVGPKLAKALFGDDDQVSVGKRINVMGTRCLIIGELKKMDRVGMSFGFSWDNLVVLPLETMREGSATVSAETILVIKTDRVESNDIVKRVANAILMNRHHGVDDFEIWDFSGIMQQFEMIFLILKLIVGFVASISLLVGGVGVMNMMFVSVSERTKEIGIRKALGASPTAIQSQFLFEAMFLSSIGGLLGISLGVVFAIAANVLVKHLQPVWVGTVSVPAVIVALLVSLSVGIGFGFVPAKRAAKLDAVDAMRR